MTTAILYLLQCSYCSPLFMHDHQCYYYYYHYYYFYCYKTYFVLLQYYDAITTTAAYRHDIYVYFYHRAAMYHGSTVLAYTTSAITSTATMRLPQLRLLLAKRHIFCHCDFYTHNTI